jgi:hypothetical protein
MYAALVIVGEFAADKRGDTKYDQREMNQPRRPIRLGAG